MYSNKVKAITGLFPIHLKPTHRFYACGVLEKMRNTVEPVFFVAFQDAASHDLYGKFFDIDDADS